MGFLTSRLAKILQLTENTLSWKHTFAEMRRALVTRLLFLIFLLATYITAHKRFLAEEGLFDSESFSKCKDAVLSWRFQNYGGILIQAVRRLYVHLINFLA